MSGDPAGRASTCQVPDHALRTRADMGVAPNYPSTEDSNDMSVTNSEVESAMNHHRQRAALHDPGFSKEAFDAFSSVDAYIRAAQDGLARATDQHLKDMRVSVHCTDLVIIYH